MNSMVKDITSSSFDTHLPTIWIPFRSPSLLRWRISRVTASESSSKLPKRVLQVVLFILQKGWSQPDSNLGYNVYGRVFPTRNQWINRQMVAQHSVGKYQYRYNEVSIRQAQLSILFPYILFQTGMLRSRKCEETGPQLLRQFFSIWKNF